MQRRRRIITRAIVFLLLGATVNVGVAWGCALWSPFQSCAPVDFETRPQTLDRLLPATDRSRLAVEEAKGFGRCDLLVDDPGIDDQPAVRMGGVALQRNTGWPVLSLSGSLVRRYDSDSAQFITRQDSLVSAPAVGGQILEMRGEKIIGLEPWVPLRPIWPGFAINTLIYAVILWGLFAAPFALRRRLRIKRGLCPACAYPIGASDVCTECGKPLNFRSVEPVT